MGYADSVRLSHACIAVLAIVLGLAADVCTDIVGQSFIGAGIWAVLLILLMSRAIHERVFFMTCLSIATLGELILSLGWGLYTYRLGNIPLFVPPGHVLLLMLGLAMARRMNERSAVIIAACAGGYAICAAIGGIDTFAGVLFLTFALAWIALPGHRRLYASTFLVALVLELYGTWLGNWSWSEQVPGTVLVTTNPPGTVGAFYSALDALVVAAMVMLSPKYPGKPMTAGGRYE